MNSTHIIASAAEKTGQKTDLFTALGIDGRLLLVQILSFLILLWVLKKLVYPALLKAIDDRQASIESAAEAAQEAQKSAEKAEEETEAQLEKAKLEAAEIVTIAHKEATKMVEEAEAKANKRAEHMLAQAESRLATDIADARAALRGEMTILVAEATEKILKQKLDSKADAKLIETALKEAN